MGIELKALGQTKVTVPLAVLGGLFFIGFNAKDFTIENLDEFFFSEAQGEELAEQITKLNTTVTTFISKSELRELDRKIDEIGDQISDTQLWIAANGANDIATARLADLVRRRDDLMEERSCLLDDSITNKELCDAHK